MKKTDKKFHRKIKKKNKFLIKQCLYLVIFQVFIISFFISQLYDYRTLTPDDCMVVTGTLQDVKITGLFRRSSDRSLEITINSETYVMPFFIVNCNLMQSKN